MEFEIIISDTCLEEIEEICDYIEKNLKTPQSANRLRIKIIKTIHRLKNSPRLYKIIDKKDRFKRVYRRIVIDNYVILYTIIDEDEVILISHMYYGGKNYLESFL